MTLLLQMGELIRQLHMLPPPACSKYTKHTGSSKKGLNRIVSVQHFFIYGDYGDHNWQMQILYIPRSLTYTVQQTHTHAHKHTLDYILQNFANPEFGGHTFQSPFASRPPEQSTGGRAGDYSTPAGAARRCCGAGHSKHSRLVNVGSQAEGSCKTFAPKPRLIRLTTFDGRGTMLHTARC